jgi:hypothetical protein
LIQLKQVVLKLTTKEIKQKAKVEFITSPQSLRSLQLITNHKYHAKIKIKTQFQP